MLTLAVDLSEQPALTCSVIHALSGWMPSLISHSPENVIYGVSSEEFEGQQATYGLMQFTGLQARQNEFSGQFSELLDAKLNLETGIPILQDCMKRGNRPEVGLLLYLGSSRGSMTQGILNLIPAYEKLISERP